MRIANLAPLALLGLFACAEATPRPPAPPVEKAAATREETAVTAAKACSKHVFDGHPEGLVDCMPDEIVQRLGGRDALVALMNKKDGESAPPDIEDTLIDAPAEMVKGEKRTFTVIPQTVTVKIPEGRLVLRSYLLGVSADDGKTWKFVDGVELDRAKALSLFPDLPEKLTLPKVGEPELQPTHAPPAKP